MPDTPDHFILVCESCTEGLPLDEICDALTGKLHRSFAIRASSCMAGCDSPRTVGFQAVGKAQYLFGGIQTADEVQALAEFAAQYRESPDGWTNATDRPRALSRKTLSRMPRIEQGASQ